MNAPLRGLTNAMRASPIGEAVLVELPGAETRAIYLAQLAGFKISTERVATGFIIRRLTDPGPRPVRKPKNKNPVPRTGRTALLVKQLQALGDEPIILDVTYNYAHVLARQAGVKIVTRRMTTGTKIWKA